MSLNRISLGTLVKKQLQYKTKVQIGMFTSLVIVQIIGFLFSLGGNGGGYAGFDEIELSYTVYSIYNIFTFTSLWALIHAVIMTTKKDWENSFPFVGNGLSNDLSNIIFLIGASMIAAILTVLTAFALRSFVYFVLDEQMMGLSTFELTSGDVASGLVMMTFHYLLLCALGYFLGTLTRLHRLMPVLVPVIIIGLLFTIATTRTNMLMNLIEFYYQETNPLLFILKVSVTMIGLFGVSILISMRTEVRK